MGQQAEREEESKAVKVSVWWDFENCHVPQAVNVCRIAQRVSAALRAAGVRGPLSITAFGDVIQLSRSAQEALVATGIAISHVPNSGKNSSDRSFMADLVYWIAQNPPPAHFFLISGDKDFANILHRLRMSNYNILLACPSSATNVLCSAATIMWPWEALVKGEDFSPKRFNHPPDGLSGSWYGHYKGALDDPFIDTEAEETMAIPVRSDIKHCPNSEIAVNTIPASTVNGIREALSSYPNGVSLSILRDELKRNNVFLGYDFFGHKKFSCLIQSMPDVVEFTDSPLGTNQPYVVGVKKILREPNEKRIKPLNSAESNAKDNNRNRETHNDKTHPASVSTLHSEQNRKTLNSSRSIFRDRSFMQTVNKNSPTFAVSSSSDVLSEDRKECATADMNPETELPADHKEVDARTVPGTPSSSRVENTVNRDGLLKRIWILWNGSESAKCEVSPCSESTSAGVVGDSQTPQKDHSSDQSSRLLNKIHKTSSQHGSSAGIESSAAMTANFSALSDNEDSETVKHAEKMGMLKSDPSILQNSKPCNGPASVPLSKAEKNADTSKMNKGLFSWAMEWWKFGKSDAENSTTNKSVSDEASADLTMESESLEASTSGSEQQVVNKIFTKFYFWDVLERQLSKPLGSELISKAKTREELAHGLENLDCWPLKGLVQKDLDHLVHLLVSEKKWIEETPSRYFPFRLTLPLKRTHVPSNPSKSGLSSLFSNGKPLEQGKHVDDKGRTNRTLTREETLSDCHKLLKDLLLQYEDGFNISIFKRHFAQKHGYELDHQKLGYADLESLLQIMPGVIVKFPRVLPAENENGRASKGDGNESSGDDFIWEELGPVSAATRTAKGVDKETCYQSPTHSEDDFSDNDNQADQQPKRDSEQSSLLQIIDSWSSSKDDGSSNKLGIDGLVDCSRSSSPGYLDTLKSTRPTQKQYCFVSGSDSEEDKEKDKLVESVLGSLQKARGAKVPN